MSISWIQSASFSNGGSTTINLAYSNPNIAGNLGVAFCFTANGLNPSSLSDSNGNTWCLINYIQTNLGAVSAWVCASLLAGSNTVTAVFSDTPSSGTPSMHIHEYAYNGPATFMSLQPVWNTPPNFYTAFLYHFASYSSGGAAINNLSIAVLTATYDQGSSHSWTASTPSIIRAVTQEASRATTVSGDAIVNTSTSPIYTYDCEFENNTPMPSPYDNLICGFMIISPEP